MMRGYTTVEQSKKLAEILPIESADMYYVRKTHDFMGNPVDGELSHPKYGNPNSKHANCIVQNFTTYEKLPCWTLTALLNVIPNELKNNEGYYLTLMNDGEWFCDYRNIDGDCNKQVVAKNPIDACVKMIELLHKENLI